MVCELRQKNGTKVTEKNKGKREKSGFIRKENVTVRELRQTDRCVMCACVNPMNGLVVVTIA